MPTKVPGTMLIKSTSGIRGIVGRGIDPILAANYAAAYGTLLKNGKVVVGRDSRPSGAMLTDAVTSGLISVGINVIDIGTVPTPTVGIAVRELKARAGICITASHNPAEWNALKFFNGHGEFITPQQYQRLEKIFEWNKFSFKPYNKLGKPEHQTGWVKRHINKTLKLKTVNGSGIRKRKFKVVVDAINGAGSDALPMLLEQLGVRVFKINCNGDGKFVHEPEPVPKNLSQLGRAVRKHKADFGLACDPDADRLALVDERGIPIGEELTLAIAVREVLRRKRGPVVTNLSTSRVTADEATKAGSKVYLSKVGESNVVQMMNVKKAVIGGEGNGGVIYPVLHKGRDALAAASLVLSCVARENTKLSKLVETFDRYYTIKSKGKLPRSFSQKLKRFEKEIGSIVDRPKLNRLDGLRVDFPDGWLLVRKSNTEPIFRVMVETNDKSLSANLSKEIMKYFAG